MRPCTWPLEFSAKDNRVGNTVWGVVWCEGRTQWEGPREADALGKADVRYPPEMRGMCQGCLLVSPKLNGAQIIRAFLHSVTPGVSNSASDPQSSSFGFSFS